MMFANNELMEKLYSNTVEDDKGCYIWQGSKTSGYGVVSFQHKFHYVHRIIYEIFNGPIQDGCVVMHLCNVRACCRIEHLKLGTQSENMMYSAKYSPVARTFGKKTLWSCLYGSDLVAAILKKTKQDENGCCLWQQALYKNGYGKIYFRGKYSYVHRVVYQALKGDIPSGMVIRHTCNIKSCCRPEHLVVGTRSENQFDVLRSGYGSVSLNPDKVLKIKELREAGHSQQKIADILGVSKSAIKHVLRGRTWTWVKN